MVKKRSTTTAEPLAYGMCVARVIAMITNEETCELTLTMMGIEHDSTTALAAKLDAAFARFKDVEVMSAVRVMAASNCLKKHVHFTIGAGLEAFLSEATVESVDVIGAMPASMLALHALTIEAYMKKTSGNFVGRTRTAKRLWQASAASMLDGKE